MKYIYYKLNKPLKPVAFYRLNIIQDHELEVFNNSKQIWVKSMYDCIYEVIKQSGYLEDTIYYEETTEDEVIKAIIMKELIS